MKFSTTLRNSRADAIITAAGTNPKIKFYNGTESLSPAGTLLATLNVTGALGTASSGVIDFNETVTQTNSLVSLHVKRDLFYDTRPNRHRAISPPL